MNLENYLEKDIISFLEKKEDERNNRELEVEEEREEFKEGKDYYELFKKALSNNKVEQARSIFEEVQEKFASAENNTEKEAYTGLIETMFTEMKDYSTEKGDNTNFIEDITNLTPKEKTNEDEESKRLRKEIEEIHKKILMYLRHDDLASAIKDYQKMKSGFSEFPDDNKEEKEEIFNKVASVFDQIKKLEDIKRKIKDGDKELSENKKQETLSRTREDVQILTKKIELSLKKNDLTKAMEDYEDLKDMFERFPKEYLIEKKALYKHTISLYKIIKKSADKIIKSKKADKNLIHKEVTEESEKLTNTDDNEKKDLDFMLGLKAKLKSIIQLTKERQIHEAELQLIETKSQINLFPRNKEEEKERFKHIIEEITNRINFLKQTENV